MSVSLVQRNKLYRPYIYLVDANIATHQKLKFHYKKLDYSLVINSAEADS